MVLARHGAGSLAPEAVGDQALPFFGALLAGLVGGLGGGMLRDVLLVLEPAVITTWYYVPIVLAAAVTGAVAVRRVHISRLPKAAVPKTSFELVMTPPVFGR